MLLSKIQGCLLGIMIGDAMGMPCEMMTPEAILAATNGQGITGFISPIQRKIKDTQNMSAGMTTDDYQLTEIICNSLIRRKGFDITDIALAHVETLITSTFGWGGTTRDGVKELQEYFQSYGKSGRSIYQAPVHSPNRGLGNGIAMKIAPIAILEVLQHPHINNPKFDRDHNKSISFEFIHLAERVAAIGKLTHSDPRAWSAAYAIALMIGELLLLPSLAKNIENFVHQKWCIERLIKKVARFKSKYNVIKDGFADRMSNLLDEKLLFGPIEKLREVIGTGCISLQSVCFALAIFFRHPKDFKVGILEAVNSGFDTDTIAAIAGAMIGVTIGVEQIPSEWANFNPEFKKALELGEKLLNEI